MSVHDDPESTSISFCIEDTPSNFTVEAAETAIENEVFGNAGWGGVPGVDTGDLLDLTMLETCSGQDIKLRMDDTLSASQVAVTSSTEIRFNSDKEFSLASNPPNDYFSYEGIAMHEVGHVLNYGHSGNYWWNVDNSQQGAIYDPTMESGASTTDSEKLLTLEKDDQARVAWSENDSVGDWWSYSPGFEDGFGFWEKSSGAWLSTIEYTGARSAMLPGFNDVVKQKILYDPWKTGSCSGCPKLYPGMDNTPLFRLYTMYRDSGNATGGIQLRSKERYYDYNTNTVGKVIQDEDRGTWSAITNHRTCNASNVTWLVCSHYFSVDTLSSSASAEKNAVALKIYFRSKTSTGVRVDKTGVEGW